MSEPLLSREELERRLATRNAELSAAHRRVEELAEALKEARQKLKTFQASLQFRVGHKLVSPFEKLARALRGKKSLASQTSPETQRERSRPSYHQWWMDHRITPAGIEKLRGELGKFPAQPLISIVLPVFNTPLAMLDEAVASVMMQVYANWELLIVDDASTEPHIVPRLRDLALADPRIKVRFLETNLGIALASNAAIEMAGGEFVGFLDHDDWIEPHALFEVLRAINEHPDADLIYSDEDKIDATGYFQQPFFKPDWSPDGMLSCNYLCHFTVLRRRILQEIGGFRSGFDGAQDYDLFLRATEQARQIFHIPQILYHWRISAHSTAANSRQKPAALGHGANAIAEALGRRGVNAHVEEGLGRHYRVRYEICETKKISILIPTRDRLDLLSRCVETVEAKTDYPNYEIVIIDNGSEQPETRRYFRETRHRVISYNGPFNFAAICNYGVRESDGAWILFLNNDIEAIEPGWLSAMAEHVQRPQVGAVGALLLYPDNTVQHAGVVLAEADVAAHAYLNFPPDTPENGGQVQVIRNYSAVTGACLLMRREVFEECGGFDETGFAVGLNDIDLCLRVRERGYNIIYTPYARLYHHESASRGYGKANPVEVNLMRERWTKVLSHDPFHNPNLSRRGGRYGPLSRYGIRTNPNSRPNQTQGDR